MAKELSQSIGHPDQAAAAAQLIYTSDPAYYDFWFGSVKAALTCLEKLWREPTGSLSHTHCQTWQENGQLAVLAYHHPATEVARLNTEDIQAHAQLHGDLALLQQREAMLAWLFPHLPDDVWYLRTLAVSPECRGCGLGSQVLVDIEKTARAHGVSTMHVDVDSANTMALRFYQTHGFDVVAVTKVPMLEPYRLPASFRMSKKFF